MEQTIKLGKVYVDTLGAPYEGMAAVYRYPSSSPVARPMRSIGC